jgi:platelet-activating factor acetylhydrolase IB subunit alpha
LITYYFLVPYTLRVYHRADLSVKLWNFGTDGSGGGGDDYSCVRTLQGHGHNVSSVAFDPTGELVLSSSRDGTVRLWEAATGFCVRTFRGHGSSWVRRVVVDASGTFAASCSDDHRGLVWDLRSLAVVATLTGHDHVVEDISFSLGGEADDATLKAIRESGASVPDEKREDGGSGASSSSAGGSGGEGGAAPRSRFLVTTSRDKTVRVFHAASGSALMTLVGHDNWVRAARFHPAGSHILSVADDRTLRMWDLRTGRCSKKIPDAHRHFVSTLAVWAQSGIIVTGSIDNTCSIWESV